MAYKDGSPAHVPVVFEKFEPQQDMAVLEMLR
jgi:hypothetical protein